MSFGRIASIQTSNERGGAEYANVDLLIALQRHGHDVLLLTDLPDIADAAGVPAQSIDLGPKLNRRTVGLTARNAPLTLWRICRALRAAQPVAFTLLHFKKEQLLCSLLPGRLTGALVWAEWGPVPEQFRHGIARLLYVRAARRTRRILAVSEGTRDSIVRLGVPADKVAVVPNVMDVDALRFDPAARERLRGEWGVAPDAFVVGCITRLQRRKRVDVAIDAIARLDGDGTLVVAGRGESEAELRERAAAHGERIRFVWVPRERVPELLSACDVVLFTPSPTEGQPRVIIESQLLGIPVIATDTPGTAGLIGEGTGAIVSPPHDPVATAELLSAYRDDPARRRREAAVGQRLALERHSPQRLVSLIERLLAPS